MAFVCEELDGTTGACLSWVEAVTVPPLTIAQGLELSGYLLACWATAWAVRFTLNFLLNRRE